MWEIQGDEFRYEETVTVAAPLSKVYDIVAGIDRYDEFLSDVVLSESEADGRCHLIVRAGPLRVDVRTEVEYDPNKLVRFRMVEGPPVEDLVGSWSLLATAEGSTEATFRVYIKAGRAGNWLLKTAGKYVERKGKELIEVFTACALQPQQ